MAEQTPDNRMTIIFFSGTMDKAFAMLFLAVTGASMGMEVSVFFTFWGLNFLKKGRRYRNKNLLQRMMEFMMPSRRDRLPLSAMNMFGMGPAMMEQLMRVTKTPSLDELFSTARSLGVKFYACTTSCGVMGIDRESLVDGVTDMVGAAAFLAEARRSRINLFI